MLLTYFFFWHWLLFSSNLFLFRKVKKKKLKSIKISLLNLLFECCFFFFVSDILQKSLAEENGMKIPVFRMSQLYVSRIFFIFSPYRTINISFRKTLIYNISKFKKKLELSIGSDQNNLIQQLSLIHFKFT